MKVAVIGGTGTFGSRLVQLLVRDGHEVIIAARTFSAAQALAREMGASAMSFDRAGDHAPLWAQGPDVVVDAAGPFHAYGADPYALPKACIDHGVHYLDLADDADFCAGIATLDDAARAAGVFVLSGLSSVPAISSAAVAALAKDAIEIDEISSAILPGNRAPRGRAVVESILHQSGTAFEAPVDGLPRPIRSWSQPETFDLGAGMRRRGWMIVVPDQTLFAAYFGARSVDFRAGLELGVMNHALAVLSWMRGWRHFAIRPWFVSAILRLAALLGPFGSDRGGMSVTVKLRSADGWETRNWRMRVLNGDGPFIPAVAARAVLRKPTQISSGARAALCVVPLDDISTAMADLSVVTEMVTGPCVPVFAGFLGAAMDELPATVASVHDVIGPRVWAGRGQVKRGRGLWSRLLARLFGFPPAADNIAVEVLMVPSGDGETWERRFGDRRFRSHLRQAAGEMTERFGPFTFTLDLHVKDGALHFPVKRGRLGPLAIPRALLPISTAREFAQDGKFHFDVALHAPVTGALMVHYQGWLERAADRATA
ncbi:DUF4166 domain-containing protein [Yoonia sp. SS1-5]|uniref:SDR family oxidoreductase n=1 Tax=Yoonia rhodophyticola TaxID=3137370 RepID=A0AAN0NM74_9RHOB